MMQDPGTAVGAVVADRGPDGKILWRKLGWDEAELRALLLK